MWGVLWRSEAGAFRRWRVAVCGARLGAAGVLRDRAARDRMPVAGRSHVRPLAAAEI